MNQRDFAVATPVYEYLPGWDEDISGARKFGDLPVTAQDYVRFLEDQSQCRISAIGVGQDRAQTILVHDLVD
jgi:adenylosuccinate synthase